LSHPHASSHAHATAHATAHASPHAHATAHAHASVSLDIGVGSGLQPPCLVGLDGLPHCPACEQVNRHVGRLEDVESVGAHVAGQHGLCPLLDDELGRLDTGSAWRGHGRVVRGFEFHGFCVNKDVSGAPSKDRAGRCIQVRAISCYDNFHLLFLLFKGIINALLAVFRFLPETAHSDGFGRFFHCRFQEEFSAER
jgi:hypothetical protein